MSEHVIVVATDGSSAGLQAETTATWIADEMNARLCAVTVLPTAGPIRHPAGQTVNGEFSAGGTATLSKTVLVGLPGIEIVRHAESEQAELLVLGRSARSMKTRWLVGDTGDAVRRRSQIPCLFVPPGQARITRALVAVDGTPRGRSVLLHAQAFARALGISLRALTVVPEHGGGPDRQPLLHRSIPDLGVTIPEDPNGATPRLTRNGEVIDEILAELAEGGDDLLVIGYHRGGPVGILDAHSIGRRLAHWAPTAVLTIPL